MDNGITVLLLYFTVINIITFAAYGIDKRAAVRGDWRIPEKTLLALAAVGGAIGAAIAMKFFHHKTKKLKFIVAVPACICVHIAIAWIVVFVI